jgi:hypothetical protein
MLWTGHASDRGDKKFIHTSHEEISQKVAISVNMQRRICINLGCYYGQDMRSEGGDKKCIQTFHEEISQKVAI